MTKKIIGRVNAQRKKDFPNLENNTIYAKKFANFLAEMHNENFNECSLTARHLLKDSEKNEALQILALWLSEKSKRTDFDLNYFISSLLDYQVSHDIDAGQILKDVAPGSDLRESQLTVSKKWQPVGKHKIGMKPVPVVNLAGEWLAQRGFEIGEVCRVFASDGSILIQTLAKHG